MKTRRLNVGFAVVETQGLRVTRMEVMIVGMSETSCKRYEYSNPVGLSGDSGIYFSVPASIILDADGNDKRVTAFSFFSVRRGLDCGVTFSINAIVEWLGRKQNRNSNGINGKLSQAIKRLRDEGYVSFSDKLGNSSCINATFDMEKVSDECDQGWFAVIYFDELKKIMDYRNPNSKDAFLNNDVILLVFAYLRMRIHRRRNRLYESEINVGNEHSHECDVMARRVRMPEAYDCYYYEIAEELGISVRTVSKAVAVLNEIGLICSEALPRINKDGKWRTDHTVFCNAYKREGGNLLAEGSEYYMSEIERKKKKLNAIAANRKIG